MKQLLACIKNELAASRKRPFLIAIDGCCGSGKTTLAAFLQKQLDCSVFHMDDFFLQPQQRTTERLTAPGGNVDYERFQKEVLDHIHDTAGVTHQIYNCSTGTLADIAAIPYHDIVIVEGAYSQHPYFKNCYDLRIFLDIPKEEQEQRIRMRNGETRWPMFRDKWIPMENRYFETFQIKENSDYAVSIQL
ncbi:MAG: AAA family ATPase [Lachnospiraceae bacterium]|nr:AAA family ATPase [Lachnospiraceae bacterium]